MNRPVSIRFTLIELLVVVAIISILASMLLPALSSARGVARTSVCAGNLKQQAMAAVLYAEDHDGVLPWGWNGLYDIAHYADHDTPITGYGSGTFALLLLPYLQDLRFYACPSFPQELKDAEAAWAQSQWGVTMTDWPTYFVSPSGNPGIGLVAYRPNAYLETVYDGTGYPNAAGTGCTKRGVKGLPLWNQMDDAAGTVFTFDAGWTWNAYAATPGCANIYFTNALGNMDRADRGNYQANFYWTRPNIGLWHQGRRRPTTGGVVYSGKSNVSFFDCHVECLDIRSGKTYEDLDDSFWRFAL